MEAGGLVCGIDEVGRAPLAGPVVSACVAIRDQEYNNPLWHEINDSKKLSREKRERLCPQIRKKCYSWAIGIADVNEIDSINIYHASLLSMRRAFDNLCLKCSDMTDSNLIDSDISRSEIPGIALVDGNADPKISCKTINVIKGDTRSVSIAAASIIAKVYRDKLMQALHQENPVYGWDRNSGYPTPEHISGIKANGITIHHRRSFAPVREYIRLKETG